MEEGEGGAVRGTVPGVGVTAVDYLGSGEGWDTITRSNKWNKISTRRSGYEAGKLHGAHFFLQSKVLVRALKGLADSGLIIECLDTDNVCFHRYNLGMIWAYHSILITTCHIYGTCTTRTSVLGLQDTHKTVYILKLTYTPHPRAV